MSAQNRVTPSGDLVAIPLRGAWTGNRGILHEGRRIVRFHGGNLWIICALQFHGRWHEQWRPHHLTWLYFHDEAVGLAAGHRPCGECRRRAYLAYRGAWGDGLGVAAPSAQQMNRQLHGERLVSRTRTRRVHALAWRGLPDGAFVRAEDGPAVVVDDHLTVWTTTGYGARLPRPRNGRAQVLTPPSSVAVLRAGYPIQIDDGAR